MKLIYIANARIPTEKAHGIQIMKMCEVFADLGHEVTLFVPSRVSVIKTDPFEYYSVKNNFKIVKIFTLDFVKLGRIGFVIESVIFGINSAVRALLSDEDLVYGRDEIALSLVSVLSRNKRCAWESHTGQNNFFAKIAIRYSKKLIVISQGLSKHYENLGVKKEKIVVAHDGVNLKEFNYNAVDICAKYNLPVNKKLIVYTGKLGGWKGVDTLFKAGELLSDNNLLVVAGGSKDEISNLKHEYPRAVFLGHITNEEVLVLQSIAHVLVIPNTGKSEISRNFTSPLKVFEYMRSGVPIVASDLSSIREILDDNTAYFAKPDDPKSFADTINKVLVEYETALVKAKNALMEVKKYSWHERAKLILENL